jgi:hypothetical protein
MTQSQLDTRAKEKGGRRLQATRRASNMQVDWAIGVLLDVVTVKAEDASM